MGEVFLARDRVLGRDVALKVLRRQYAGDSEFAERFKREARSAASLSHPNIVQVYDRGETDEGASYIAMEYVPGGTLKERISDRGPLEASEAAALGAQVAEALGAAHDRGMVHRDIKPQNVLLTTRGDAKVADFGIARAGSSVTISKTGSVMGTAGYMSPEQALGEPATPRSDLYSLGVVLYEALTGELPFTADNPIAVSMKHVTEALRPPREIDPTIPEGMNALIVKLMAKDPEDRYASAGELADDLRRVSRGLPPAAVGKLPRPRTQRTAVAQNPTSKMPSANPAPLRRRKSLPWLLSPSRHPALPRYARRPPGPRTERHERMVRRFRGGQNPPDKPSAPQQVRVPEVAGLTRGEAQQRLINEGLEVGEITSFPSERIAFGRVIAPGYAAGTPVDLGTEVNLTVSSGPQPASSASPSARSSASAQPSPGPANSIRPSASAQPARQEDRRPLRQPGAGANVPRTNAPETGVQQSPPAREPNGAAPVREPADDSGPQGRGENSGHSGERGED